MTPQEKIEEAHGLWELAIVRLATMIELNEGNTSRRKAALAEERASYKNWQEISHKAVREV